ncbi:MAG TPA: FliM/FliN family flagellar motor switch protein [Anaeromyxobacter sp.]|nr:FliM/FliN family flagellar motor switch protein [Anaeromyxobacter sp.]
MAFPFDLPALSRGYAALTPAARAAGVEAAEGAARALGCLLGCEVAIRGRPVPGPASPRPCSARVRIELAALPAAALLEVDPSLVISIVDRLAGGPGEAGPASSLTPVEGSTLDLLALAALEGAAGAAGVEAALAPRLGTGGDPSSALGIELELETGPLRGRARLLLPPAALRALAGAPSASASRLALPGSLRRGAAPVAPDELRALAPGDVVVVDPPGDGRDTLLLPGGLRAAGRVEDDAFHVEEVHMAEPNAHLPVLLEVELARIEVPLSDLARLEPGSVLPLALDRRGLVALRVGERAVARGELVDLEGAVGVRILSVEGAP